MKKENKSIYDKLDGLKAPINKEQSWGELYHRDGFPKKEKKRRRFLWILFGLGALLLITSLLINYNFNNQVPANSDLPKGLKAETEIILKSPSMAHNQEDLNGTSNDTATGDAISIKKKDNTTLTADSNKGITSRKVEDTYNEKSYIENRNPTSNGLNKIVNQNNNNNYNQQANIVQKINIPATTMVGNDTSKTYQQQVRSTVGQVTINKLALIQYQIPLVPQLPLNTFSTNKDRWAIISQYSNQDLPSKVTRTWTIEIGGGIGSAQLPMLVDSTLIDLTFQNAHTRSLVSYMLDVRTTRALKNKWRISMGLRYSMHRRLFSYEDVSTIYTRQTNPNPYHYLESMVNTKYRFYHQHQIVDIESMLIKDFIFNKTSAYAGIGLGLNTFYRFKSQGITQDLVPIDLAIAGGYKNNLGLHFLYELGLKHQINHQYFINASISGKSQQDLNIRGSHRIAPFFLRFGIGLRF